DTGNQISQYYPFFDPNGQVKLVVDLDSKKFQQLGFLYDSLVRRTTHKKHTMLHRFNKETKSTDMFALKSDQARSEV
ncbi:MAG: hypothetical protein GTO40_21810, partial [Deltaproteobacteria bacterium]|nr:hypothetical protein [Deltaproteobacteria bacterium]